MNVLGLANLYKSRPSTLFSIMDPYTAYCFDEACAYITLKIEKGEKPDFRKANAKKHYSSFTDFYSQYT